MPGTPCCAPKAGRRSRACWTRDKGLRLDHLLLSPDLADHLVDAGVERWVRDLEGASDHAPAWIERDR